MRFLLRLVINAAALWVAVAIVPGIEYYGHGPGLLGVALVFGIVNAVVRPLLVLLTCPLVVLTLGVFLLILNALMLWLTSAISTAFGLQFHVAGFLPAFVGALVVTIVSIVLTLFVGREKKRD